VRISRIEAGSEDIASVDFIAVAARGGSKLAGFRSEDIASVDFIAVAARFGPKSAGLTLGE
jgi:hypothetical protein